ncbi:DUF3168 domain-containing protein [Sulfurimonas sp. HSL1-6]|uniref:DUF3168 domain-containing protein n=1 Tax=Thiomicrolovo immobilis TaxID=3131935 RepID=UPI0031F858F6
MSIETDLFSHLSNDSGVSALVDARIYPLTMPQDCQSPAITYQVINNRELQSINKRVPWGEEVLVQVDCWSKDFDETLAVKDAVQTAMHSFAQKAHGFNSRAMPFEPETRLHRQLIEFYVKG